MMTKNNIVFLRRDAKLAWYMLSSCVCISVCLLRLVLYQNG